MTKRVSHVQMLEDGLVDLQDEIERLETIPHCAPSHRNLEAGFTGPMPEREDGLPAIRIIGPNTRRQIGIGSPRGDESYLAALHMEAAFATHPANAQERRNRQSQEIRWNAAVFV
jgi:hypothetical protein